jgi:hypothetical protein
MRGIAGYVTARQGRHGMGTHDVGEDTLGLARQATRAVETKHNTWQERL